MPNDGRSVDWCRLAYQTAVNKSTAAFSLSVSSQHLLLTGMPMGLSSGVDGSEKKGTGNCNLDSKRQLWQNTVQSVRVSVCRCDGEMISKMPPVAPKFRGCWFLLIIPFERFFLIFMIQPNVVYPISYLGHRVS